MSFASPLWLVALTLIPLALIARSRARDRARRYAVRFPAVATLQSAVATTRSWHRYLATAAALAAVAALAVALARPHETYRVPIGEASIMLVLDHSGSMAAVDVQPSRIAAALNAADAFISQLPSSVRLGAVGFSSSPDAAQAPVTNHAAARGLIQSETANGSTDTGGALQLALQLLHGASPHHPPSAIVLLSDGSANVGENPVTVAGQARRDRIPIYTVALGTPAGTLNTGPFSPPVSVPPDPELMSQIASTSGARSFDAQTADQLGSIYKQLGSRLGTVQRQRDITFEFVIAAAGLLLVAVTASARTSDRLA